MTSTTTIQENQITKAAATCTTFEQLLFNVIPFMDLDTNRFVEWVIALRMMHGFKSSKGLIINYIRDAGYTKDTFVEFCNEWVDLNHDAPYVYRGYRINEDNPLVPDLVIAVANQNNDPMIWIAGDEVLVNRLHSELLDRFPSPVIKSVKRLIGIGPSGPNVAEESLVLEEHYTAHDAFYPYLLDEIFKDAEIPERHKGKGGIQVLIDMFRESRVPNLVFIGSPGVGKSVLINHIANMLGRDNVLYCADGMLMSTPAFMEWVESSTTRNNTLLVLEDSDNFIKSRRQGNQQMSALLNYTQGVSNKNAKLIISTNLENTQEVDPALLRPGRTFRTIEFRKLTPEQANEARAAIGLPPAQIEREVTLSEALNFDDAIATYDSQPKIRKVGF